MEFRSLRKSLTGLVSSASTFPQSAKDLLHPEDELPHISQEPDMERRNESRRRFVDAEAELVECLDEIAQVEKHLTLLRGILERRQAQFHSRSVMIQAIPPEVLSQIFWFAIELERPRPKLYRRVDLMLVSRHWCETIQGSLSLWTYQHHVLRDTDELSAIGTRFQNAGRLPLRLSIRLSSSHPSLSPASGREAYKMLGLTNERDSEPETNTSWLAQIRSIDIRGHERGCYTLLATLLAAFGSLDSQEVKKTYSLSHVAIWGDVDISCSKCKHRQRDTVKRKVADLLSPLNLTSLALNRRPFLPGEEFMQKLKHLTLSNPQNMTWSSLQTMLTSMVHLEHLALTRTLSNLRPPEGSKDTTLLSSLTSLVIEAKDLPLLISILRRLSAPWLNHLGLGFAELTDTPMNPMWLTPSDIDNVFFPLRDLLSSWQYLTSLDLRLLMGFLPKIMSVLLAPFVDKTGVEIVPVPKLAHMSLPHLLGFRHERPGQLRRVKTGETFVTVVNERRDVDKKQAQATVPRQSLAIPRCILDVCSKSLRAVADVTELYCQCGDSWREDDSDIDLASGWGSESEGSSSESESDDDDDSESDDSESSDSESNDSESNDLGTNDSESNDSESNDSESEDERE